MDYPFLRKRTSVLHARLSAFPNHVSISMEDGTEMKIVPQGELEYGRIKSEGKLLEFIPILTMPDGQPYALPPVVYRVENWILGYNDYHSQGMPVNYYPQMDTYLHGTNSSLAVRMSFVIRIMEDSSDAPVNAIASIDAESVKDIVSVIKNAMKRDEE